MSDAEVSIRSYRGTHTTWPRIAIAAAPLLATLLLAACGSGAGEGAVAADVAADRLIGTWEAEFTAREAHAPFKLVVEAQGNRLVARIERSGEEIPVRSVERRDLVVTILASEPEVEIFAKMAPNGGSMSGFWRVGAGDAAAELPFKAWRVDPGEGG